MAIDFGNTDYQALTQQLVAAERAQRTQTVVAKAELYGEKVDAFASLRTTVNSLGTAASKLDSSLDFRNFNVDYSDAGYVNVTTSGSSPPSNLSVEVLQVGRPDQALASFNQAGGTDNGDGSVTISVGGESFSVSLSSGESSLEQLAGAINAANDNTGVRATVITTSANTSELYLESTQIGTANAITLSSTGGFSTLGGNAAAGSVPLNRAPFDGAANASIRVNGVTLTNDSSNTFDDVITGASIEALKVTSGVGDIPSQIAVSVSRDKDDVISNINAFIKSYNDLRSELRDGMSYNVDLQSAGTLYGESRVKRLDRQLTSLMTQTFGLNDGDITRPGQIGLSFDDQGNLQLDQSKLSDALDQDFDEVVGLFAGVPSAQGVEVGFADAFKSLADDYGSVNGIFDNRRSDLLESLDDLEKKQDRIDLQLEGYESVLIKQFAALEALQAQIEGTSSFLEGQFNNSD